MGTGPRLQVTDPCGRGRLWSQNKTRGVLSHGDSSGAKLVGTTAGPSKEGGLGHEPPPKFAQSPSSTNHLTRGGLGGSTKDAGHAAHEGGLAAACESMWRAVKASAASSVAIRLAWLIPSAGAGLPAAKAGLVLGQHAYRSQRQGRSPLSSSQP